MPSVLDRSQHKEGNISMSTRSKPSASKYSWKYWQPTTAHENLFTLSTTEYHWYRLIVDSFHAAGLSFTNNSRQTYGIPKQYFHPSYFL